MCFFFFPLKLGVLRVGEQCRTCRFYVCGVRLRIFETKSIRLYLTRPLSAAQLREVTHHLAKTNKALAEFQVPGRAALAAAAGRLWFRCSCC